MSCDIYLYVQYNNICFLYMPILTDLKLSAQQFGNCTATSCQVCTLLTATLSLCNLATQLTSRAQALLAIPGVYHYHQCHHVSHVRGRFDTPAAALQHMFGFNCIWQQIVFLFCLPCNELRRAVCDCKNVFLHILSYLYIFI